MSRLLETAAKLLGTRVVLGRPYIDEHSVLLDRVHPLLEQSRKEIFLKARGFVRNVLQSGAAEHIHTAVYDSRNRGTCLLGKANDSIQRVQPNGPVSRHIGDSAYCHADEPAVLAMKANELTEVHFKKGIPIHDQKIGRLREVGFRKFHSACRS